MNNDGYRIRTTCYYFARAYCSQLFQWIRPVLRDGQSQYHRPHPGTQVLSPMMDMDAGSRMSEDCTGFWPAGQGTAPRSHFHCDIRLPDSIF